MYQSSCAGCKPKIFNVRPNEVLLVTEEEKSRPPYAANPDRVLIPFVGGLELLRPCLVSRKDNTNRALATLKEFIAGLEPGVLD